jgi:hypothetical protein
MGAEKSDGTFEDGLAINDDELLGSAEMILPAVSCSLGENESLHLAMISSVYV